MTDSKALDPDTTGTDISDLDEISSWDDSTDTSEVDHHCQLSPQYGSEMPFERDISAGNLGTCAKLPRISDPTTPGRKFAPVPQTPLLPPNMMTVIMPGVAAKCQGTYELIFNVATNDQPLWKHSSKDFWLFSTLCGCWAIGVKDVMEDGFARSCGWIWQERKHYGQLPEGVPGTWWQWNGTCFEPNPDIVVVVPWRVEKQPKPSLKVEQSDVLSLGTGGLYGNLTAMFTF